MRSSILLSLVAALLPAALGAPISHDELVTNSAQGLRLLQLGETVDPVWKTEDEKLELLRSGSQFMDVTEVYERKQALAAKKAASGSHKAAAVTYPSPSQQTAVKPILSTLSTSNMASTLSSLTAFNNRYYKSSTGAQASTYILNQVKSIISGRSDISAALFSHSWTQSSIIAKIQGSSNNTAPIVILGAHMDSINLNSPTSGRAPGADDDGTGTVNLIEILRALVAADWKPKTPVEFHWYSGEEGGLLGSQDIASSYADKGVKVKAMMQLDMTGYFKPGSKEVFALEADYVDSGLNTFVKALVGAYSSLSWAMDTPCGYACSDHASWNEQGYPTTMPFEAVTGNDNDNIHSTGDTISVSGFSWSHSLEFAKVALAYVYELTA